MNTGGESIFKNKSDSKEFLESVYSKTNNPMDIVEDFDQLDGSLEECDKSKPKEFIIKKF